MNTTADEPRIESSEQLRKARIDHEANFLKKGVLSQTLMDMEVQEHVGAGRRAGRMGQCNAYREHYYCDTRVSAILARGPLP